MSSIANVPSRRPNLRASRRPSAAASAAPAHAPAGAAGGVDWRSLGRVLWRWVDRPRVVEALLALAILAQLAAIAIEVRAGPEAGSSLANPPDGAAPTMRPTESA